MAAVTTQKAITANPIHNNGGTLLFGNTSAAVTNIMGKNGIARKRIIPTTPKVRSNRITTVLGSGNFAYMGAGEYQFMNYINGKINGTAQSFPYVRGRRGKVYSVNSSTGRKVSYLVFPLYFLSFANGAVSVSFTTQTDTLSFGRDDANTNPYTDVAGEFVFNPTGKLPSQNSGNHKYYSYSRVK